MYELKKRGSKLSRDEVIANITRLCTMYPIISVEDPLDQRDFEGWSKLTAEIGNKCMLVGDDLFVTNPKRLREGIEKGSANAILVKPNQIGTLSEVCEVVGIAKSSGYNYILSHRSGETEDTTIADIAVGLNAPFIKSGAPCRTDRVAKYNRLLRIEASLGKNARYGLNKENYSSVTKTYCGEA